MLVNIIIYALIALFLWLCIPKDKTSISTVEEIENNYEGYKMDMMFGEDR